MPIIQLPNGQLAMDRLVLEQWERLNLTLNTFVNILRHADPENIFVSILSRPREPLYYLDRLRMRTWNAEDRDQAEREAFWALKSFYPHLAFVSYVIATFPGHSDVPAHWISTLHDAKQEHSLVDNVANSEVTMFEQKIRRMGALVPIATERHNYSVYVRCHVPAWFELSAASRRELETWRMGRWQIPTLRDITDSQLWPSIPIASRDLPPPPPPIQFASYTTSTARGSGSILNAIRVDAGPRILSWDHGRVVWGTLPKQEDNVAPSSSPGPAPTSSAQFVPPDFPIEDLEPAAGQLPGETPPEFFERCSRVYAKRIASETSQQRQGRIDREAFFADRKKQAAPPSLSQNVTMYEWERADGEKYFIRKKKDKDKWDWLYKAYPFEYCHYYHFGPVHGHLDFWKDLDMPDYIIPLDRMEEEDGLDPFDDLPDETIPPSYCPISSPARHDAPFNEIFPENENDLGYEYEGTNMRETARWRAGYCFTGDDDPISDPESTERHLNLKDSGGSTSSNTRLSRAPILRRHDHLAQERFRQRLRWLTTTGSSTSTL